MSQMNYADRQLETALTAMFQQKVTENKSTMRYWPAVSDRLGEQVSRRPWEYVMDAINTPKLPFKPQYIGGALVVVIAVLLLVLLFNTDDGAGAESVPADSPQQIVPESGSGEPVGDTFDPDAEAEGATLVAKWGSEGGGDGQFNRPGGVAVDASGNVYVADFDNHRVQVFSPEGRFLRKWGSEGAADGEFDGPTGVAVDGSGNVYVVDTTSHRVQVFGPEGRFLRMWGSEGAADGEFGGPTGVAVDASGNVYVVDTGSHRVQVFSSEGRFLRKWGSRGTGDGEFNGPSGVAVDGSGNVYVVDGLNARVQVFSAEGRFLRKWGSPGSGDGQFRLPVGIALDASGNAYVADSVNHRVQVFSPEGRFLMKWGSEGSGDGEFHVPALIALDASGNVFVADLDNHRVQVFSVDLTELPTPSPAPTPVPSGTSEEPFDEADMRALLSDEEVEEAIPLVVGEMRFPPRDMRGLAGDDGMVGIDSIWGNLFMSADGRQLMVIVTDFESPDLLQQQITLWLASIFAVGAPGAGDYLKRTEPTIGDGSLQGQEGDTISVRFWKGDKTVMLRATDLPGTQELLDGLIALAKLAESRLDGRREP